MDTPESTNHRKNVKSITHSILMTWKGVAAPKIYGKVTISNVVDLDSDKVY